MKLISGEKLLFADKVKKTNMFEWTQERTLVITNHAVYNIHKKDVKRCILIRDIGGISKTVPPSKAIEFTIHVPTTYDYRFSSPHRDAIIDLLKRLVLIESRKNCPIYHITFKDLKDFTTTEDDMKKKISKHPTENYRALSEDILKLESVSLKKESEDETLSNYNEQQDLRSHQLAATIGMQEDDDKI